MLSGARGLRSRPRVALEHSHGEMLARVSVEPPLRAKGGSASFRRPVGRTRDANWVHRTRKAGLRPEARALESGLHHERPLGNGRIAFGASHTVAAGHVPGEAETSLGARYRLRLAGGGRSGPLPPQPDERRNLGDLVDLALDRERVLVVDSRPGGAEWSGGRIHEQARAAAALLLARGLRRGDRVAVLAANRAEYLVTILGIMQAGLVAVPVNIRLPRATVEHVLRDSGARLAFCDADQDDLPPGIDRLALDEVGRLPPPGDLPAVPPEPGEAAMILYTSGSSGLPKGVPLTHRGHRWVIEKRRQAAVDYRAERILVAAPLYHMNALALAQLALAAGAVIVLLPRFEAGRYIDAIARHRCTLITSIPTMLALVCRQSERLAATDLSSVRGIRMGSAPVTPELVARLRGAFPGAGVQIGYGTTEAGPVVFGAHPGGRPTPELSLGCRHPDVELRLVGPGGAESDRGVLEMKCPAVMPGYHGLPERTAEVMTADGYYRTGDVMRRDADGFFFFLGREDDMFVCNGENVYAEEVERRIESMPDVAEACVVPVADEVRGHMPVAWVVPARGASPGEDDVKRYALAHGPAVEHPRRVFFLAELPLGGTNKIDRRRLAARAARLVAGDGAPLAQGRTGHPAPAAAAAPAPPPSPASSIRHEKPE